MKIKSKKSIAEQEAEFENLLSISAFDEWFCRKHPTLSFWWLIKPFLRIAFSEGRASVEYWNAND